MTFDKTLKQHYLPLHVWAAPHQKGHMPVLLLVPLGPQGYVAPHMCHPTSWVDVWSDQQVVLVS